MQGLNETKEQFKLNFKKHIYCNYEIATLQERLNLTCLCAESATQLIGLNGYA